MNPNYLLPGGHNLSREPAGLEHIDEQCVVCLREQRDEARRERYALRDWSNSNAASAVIAVEALTALHTSLAGLRNKLEARVVELKQREAADDLRHFTIAPARHNGAWKALQGVIAEIAALLPDPQTGDKS